MKEQLIQLKEDVAAAWQRRQQRIIRDKMFKKAEDLIQDFGVFKRLALGDLEEQALFKIHLAKCLLVKQNQLNPPESDSAHHLQIAVIESLGCEAQEKVENLRAARGPSSLAESPYRIELLAGLLSGVYYRNTTSSYTDFPALSEGIDIIARQHVFRAAPAE
ncbi:MAG: hypothetical protein Q8P89_03470 [bacterium]|nr:hypothetical protein [bacterium]